MVWLGLLYLHRTFFAQAVCDCPDNPLESKYATSVSATYRSACLIVAGTHDATVRHPELAARFWWFWSNLFSAAVSLSFFSWYSRIFKSLILLDCTWIYCDKESCMSAVGIRNERAGSGLSFDGE